MADNEVNDLDQYGVLFSENRLVQVMEGLRILSHYAESHVAAEHDILYAGPTGLETLPVEARVQLHRLKWHYDTESDCWAFFT